MIRPKRLISKFPVPFSGRDYWAGELVPLQAAAAASTSWPSGAEEKSLNFETSYFCHKC